MHLENKEIKYLQCVMWLVTGVTVW